MAVTLTINGIKAKVENSALEAAFAAARAESPAERGVLVTLSSPAVSKAAAAMGLGRVEYTGVGNATRKVYPGALVARVAEILGGADLIGCLWTDPAAEAEAMAAWLAGAPSARYYSHASDRTNREVSACHCCGRPTGQHEGVLLSRDAAPGSPSASEVTVCRDCLPALAVVGWSAWNGLAPTPRRENAAAPAEFEALVALEAGHNAVRRMERDI